MGTVYFSFNMSGCETYSKYKIDLQNDDVTKVENMCHTLICLFIW